MDKFLFKINALLVDIGKDLLRIKTKKNNLQKFYYEILFKNIHSFEGAIFLLKYSKQKPFFQISFISIMRDIISDLIIAEYISHKEEDSSSVIEQELEKIYSDHYRFTKKKKELDKRFFGHRKEYKTLEIEFEKYGEKYKDSNGKLKSYLKGNSLIYDKLSYIESRSKKEHKDNVRMLYSWYSEFSKIAHFGEVTFNLIQEKYSSNDDKALFNNYYELLNVILIFFVGLLDKVNLDQKISIEIEKDMKELWKYKISA